MNWLQDKYQVFRVRKPLKKVLTWCNYFFRVALSNNSPYADIRVNVTDSKDERTNTPVDIELHKQQKLF